MNYALERLHDTIENLEHINEILKENDEYKDQLDELNDQLKDFEDGRFLDKIYPPITDESKDRNMALSDMLQYMILGRGYYEVTSRQSDNTINDSYQNFYKIVLKLINLLYLQDSILTQKENHDLREKLVEKLKNELSDDEDSSSYRKVEGWDSFLHQPWGDREAEDGRNNVYKKLDQLLPKVRGNPNEFITYIHLLRKRTGYVIPLLTHQRIMGSPPNMQEEKLVDKLTPPDLLILKKNKEIYGIEIGRGSDRQINKFTKSTGIPVITADTNKISNHRCPKCMKWTLFCPFVIENGMDKRYRKKDQMQCSQCGLVDKNNGKNCEFSLIKKNIPEFYDGKAHYHYHCVKEHFENKEETLDIDDEDIFTYFPYVKGLEVLQKS